ncbi:MAG: cytidine deaminase [Parachlamydia sp.]|nr:MAG: cytidine deaminase [Parachlamydia sp.]
MSLLALNSPLTAVPEFHNLLNQSTTMSTADIKKLIPAHPFLIEAAEVHEILQTSGLTLHELMQKLIPIAQELSHPAISQYKVGAVGLGESGAIYLGVNLEFTEFPLNQCVHGEQFLVANMKNAGETGLVSIALSAAPCGHCRQFLNEIDDGQSIKILIPNRSPLKLSELLPDSFGPQDLGFKGGLLNPLPMLEANHACPVTAKALQAAQQSYAPYSNSQSGVAIKTRDAQIFTGSYLENVGFNPSLSPLQTALVALFVAGKDYEDISEVVLVEDLAPMISQAAITEQLLKSVAPEAAFKLEKIDLPQRQWRIQKCGNTSIH